MSPVFEADGAAPGQAGAECRQRVLGLLGLSGLPWNAVVIGRLRDPSSTQPALDSSLQMAGWSDFIRRDQSSSRRRARSPKSGDQALTTKPMEQML